MNKGKLPKHNTSSLQFFLAIFLFFAWQAPSVAAQLVNQVKNSPSPYLAIHGDDPVAWQEWSSATLRSSQAHCQ